jgi:hypothetical protein
MASDETLMSTIQDEDFEDYYDHTHHHNLSRLSVCTSSTICGVDEDVDNLASMCMSNLSIESFEADGGDGDDADGEFSADGKDDDQLLQTGLSSGSENESGSCYSLPATPPRRRSLIPVTAVGVKDYASENEVRKETNSNDLGKSSSRRRRRRRRSLKSVFERGNSWENLWAQKKKMKEKENGVNSGESDHGVMVITRPKGGKRSLCMDLEEVKACRDLGFELEHERISALSFSNSTFDTSSGGNSPIANWRISCPGDDPRDVKARLKVWAQAVAIASTTKYGS